MGSIPLHVDSRLPLSCSSSLSFYFTLFKTVYGSYRMHLILALLVAVMGMTGFYTLVKPAVGSADSSSDVSPPPMNKGEGCCCMDSNTTAATCHTKGTEEHASTDTVMPHAAKKHLPVGAATPVGTGTYSSSCGVTKEGKGGVRLLQPCRQSLHAAAGLIKHVHTMMTMAAARPPPSPLTSCRVAVDQINAVDESPLLVVELGFGSSSSAGRGVAGEDRQAALCVTANPALASHRVDCKMRPSPSEPASGSWVSAWQLAETVVAAC